MAFEVPPREQARRSVFAALLVIVACASLHSFLPPGRHVIKAVLLLGSFFVYVQKGGFPVLTVLEVSLLPFAPFQSNGPS